MALWSGRFNDENTNMAVAFGESVSFDQRLYAHDIRGSIAHVSMLAKTGIIPEKDAKRIVAELNVIKSEIENGDFEFKGEFEDVHMNIEKSLIERLGAIGAKVHTARSRNDQVATDMRLYVRDEINEISQLMRGLQCALRDVAERYKNIPFPGLTHLQNAQPVLFAHHLLAYIEMLARDQSRLVDCQRRLNFLPLGAGALAGTTLPIDRTITARDLGFDGVMRNSMDAVSDRDFVIEFVAGLAIVAVHISRLSEDIIYWMSQACAFIELDEKYCTGSSLMPQKKNPDIAELSRGKSGRVFGDLMSLLTLMKGLPLCYNRDMQEDKEALFDAVDTTKNILTVFAPMIRGIRLHEETINAAISDPYLMATDLAEWLVKQGIPFRDAHEKVGKLVGYCQTNSVELDTIGLEKLQEIIPEANAECLDLFSAETSIANRTSQGGTSPVQVEQQLKFWKNKLYDGSEKS